MISDKELIAAAKAVAKKKKSTAGVTGEVGCALLTREGNVFVGVSIDIACGIGFCAEHSAVAAMVTAGETEIKKIVAVKNNGTILPPCGRCRELLYQMSRKNANTEVLLGKKTLKISELLPEYWQKTYYS